jgi:hypothetical protein
LVDQAVMDSVEGKFEPVRNAELVENIMKMVFHRLFADEKLFANLAVAETLGHKLNDFLLAFAEQWLLASLAGLGGLLESIDDFGGHAIVEPNFSVENLADAFHQQVAG